MKQLQFTSANTHTVTIGAPIHIKQIPRNLRWEIHIETIKRHFDIPLSTMSKSVRQRNNAEILEFSLL